MKLMLIKNINNVYKKLFCLLIIITITNACAVGLYNKQFNLNNNSERLKNASTGVYCKSSAKPKEIIVKFTYDFSSHLITIDSIDEPFDWKQIYSRNYKKYLTNKNSQLSDIVKIIPKYNKKNNELLINYETLYKYNSELDENQLSIFTNKENVNLIEHLILMPLGVALGTLELLGGETSIYKGIFTFSKSFKDHERVHDIGLLVDKMLTVKLEDEINDIKKSNSIDRVNKFFEQFPNYYNSKVIKENIYWNSVNNTKDYTICDQYLVEYPDGKYYNKIKELREKFYWNEIKKSNTLQSYNDYMTEYPHGQFYKEAKSLHEKTLWDEAEMQNSIESYTKYLSVYPEGDYITANAVVTELYEYSKAKNEKSITSYERYLDKYPDGIYSKEANTNFENIIFNNAKEQNSINLYKTYLKRFPEGIYLEQVKDSIEYLVFSNAQKRNIVTDYNEYIKQYPKGKYIKKARRGKDDIQWDKVNKSSLKAIVKFIYAKKTSRFNYKRASNYISEKLTQIEKQLKDNNVEINKIGNNKNIQKQFYLPVPTEVLVVMTGEKKESSGLELMMSSKEWVDFGGIKAGNKEYFPLSSGYPAGGRRSAMYIEKYVKLMPNEYNLYYQTDAGFAWNDFRKGNPTYPHWGISVYFFDFPPLIRKVMDQLLSIDRKKIFSKQFKRIRKIAHKISKKAENDRRTAIKLMGKKSTNYKYYKDINKIENFIKKHPNNYWKEIFEHILREKKMTRVFENVKFSKSEATRGPVVINNSSLLSQIFSDAKAKQDKDFSKQLQKAGIHYSKGVDHYFWGIVENTSKNITYNLNIMCDFEVKTETVVGVWILKKRIVSTDLKFMNYYIKDLKPGEKRPYVFAAKSGSGSGLGVSIIAFSSNSHISLWGVNFSEIDRSLITNEILKHQKNLLAQSGVDNYDFTKNSFNIPTQSLDLGIDFSQSEMIDINEIDF